MAATGVCFRYYTTRTRPCGGRVRSIRGAGWPRSTFVMTRSDFQKKSSSEATPNLAPNTARKVYVCIPGHDNLASPCLGRNALAARKTLWPQLRGHAPLADGERPFAARVFHPDLQLAEPYRAPASTRVLVREVGFGCPERLCSGEFTNQYYC